MRPEAVWTVRRTADALLPSMAHRSRGAGVKLCASLSLRAQSSQHTSTVLPPIFTLMEFASSLQSQAAQVFSVMTALSDEYPHLRER
jgi:hypothetical protein